nr:heavy metal-associated isoprenylated plant protein 37 [Tanacetum cinerariifolium]
GIGANGGGNANIDGYETGQNMMMSMNGLPQQDYNFAAAAMMMNMENKQSMYQRSPVMAPNTRYYYYNYNPDPYPYSEPHHHGYYHNGYNGDGASSDANMLSGKILGPNDDHICEEDSPYLMSSSVSDIRDDVAHAQTNRDGGNVMIRSLIRSADFVDVIHTDWYPIRMKPHVFEMQSAPPLTYGFKPDLLEIQSISTVTPIDCCVSTPVANSPLVTPTSEHASRPVATQTRGTD